MKKPFIDWLEYLKPEQTMDFEILAFEGGFYITKHYFDIPCSEARKIIEQSRKELLIPSSERIMFYEKTRNNKA